MTKTPSPVPVKAWAVDWGKDFRLTIEWTREDARAARANNYWMEARIYPVLIITPLSSPGKRKGLKACQRARAKRGAKV